jgi:hypothetical protein
LGHHPQFYIPAVIGFVILARLWDNIEYKATPIFRRGIEKNCVIIFNNWSLWSDYEFYGLIINKKKSPCDRANTVVCFVAVGACLLSKNNIGDDISSTTHRWRKLHKELNNLYSSPTFIRVIKSRGKISAVHVVLMEEIRNAYKVLSEHLKIEDHFEGRGVDGRIILELLLKKCMEWIHLAQCGFL